MVRSLGLRRLNQVVERVDSPQVRGLVARIPQFVEIVSEAPRPPVWADVQEYTLLPKEVASPEAPAASATVPAAEAEADAVQQPTGAVPAVTTEQVGETEAATDVGRGQSAEEATGSHLPQAQREKANAPTADQEGQE